MNANTTIYGYTHDGAAYHPGCLPENLHPEADASVAGLFSWDGDEWPYGLSCDKCFDYIFEPREPKPKSYDDALDAALRAHSVESYW